MRGQAYAATVLLCVAALVVAQAKPVEGVIVSVKDGEMIVDLGRESGLVDHAERQVYRRLEVRHPITGKRVRDRFFVGIVTLDRVGMKLSIAWSCSSKFTASGEYNAFGTRQASLPTQTPDQMIEAGTNANSDVFGAFQLGFRHRLLSDLYDSSFGLGRMRGAHATLTRPDGASRSTTATTASQAWTTAGGR